MKILVTADAVGGVWQYSIDLIRALAQHGADVMLATMGARPTAAQRDEVSCIPGVTCIESDYALEWMPDTWRDVDAAGGWLLHLEASFKPDVVHLNGYTHANLPWKKRPVVVAHSCVYSWWRAVHGCAPGAEWAEYKRRVADGLAASGTVIAPSASMAAALQREYGVAREKIQVIHNFTSAQFPSYQKQPFVLAAGRVWDVAKNFQLLDRIAPKLECEVRIAGSTSKTHGSAIYLGSLSRAELMDQMCAASMFAHPALYEPFGLSVLEAARARCCLVLSDIPSLRELWAEAAVFVNPREPNAWIDQIHRLIDDAETRKRLGEAAYSQSLRYREASSLKQYWDVYTFVIESETGVAA